MWLNRLDLCFGRIRIYMQALCSRSFNHAQNKLLVQKDLSYLHIIIIMFSRPSRIIVDINGRFMKKKITRVILSREAVRSTIQIFKTPISVVKGMWCSNFCTEMGMRMKTIPQGLHFKSAQKCEKCHFAF